VNYFYVLILAVIQGLCELLPVSSSAHVIVTEKLLGLNPSSPEMTFLLVMLHSGTMFAVIAYFWNAWKRDYFSSQAAFVSTLKVVVLATAVTGIIGFGLQKVIEKVVLKDHPGAEIEDIFGNLRLIAAALAGVGILIFAAGRVHSQTGAETGGEVGTGKALLIGFVQGLCLPFRGFSRSGATISTGLLAGVSRQAAERFSFALAVVLTPPVVAREALRLFKPKPGMPRLEHGAIAHLAAPGLAGMVLSFLAGLVALRWLSGWLEAGRWSWFGIYCLLASVGVYYLAAKGF
jgi:undecaprenyl-diphosphatase